MNYEVVIVGGGPGGLSAALALGRARKRVLIADSGPRRNAAAVHMQNFVTRDGTPPSEFRAIGREQLLTYPSVEVRDAPVVSISGTRGDFRVTLPDGTVAARRILLCTGLIEERASGDRASPAPVRGWAPSGGKAGSDCLPPSPNAGHGSRSDLATRCRS